MKTLWITGAADPEMQAIKALLTQQGQTVASATVNGSPVHAGNAYQADDVSISIDPFDELVFIECGGPTIESRNNLCEREAVRIDHHRPGDPGFGRPPSEFLPASSLGQVILALSERGIPLFDAAPTPTGMGFQSGGNWAAFELDGRKWFLHREGADMSWYVQVSGDLVLTAAADHCLGAAYQGKCPGVNPDALMAWRIKTRAAFQGRSVQAVFDDIAVARQILRNRLPFAHNGTVDLRGGMCTKCRGLAVVLVQTCPDLCLSASPLEPHNFVPIPELPEAAAREGIAFLSEVKDSCPADCKRKPSYGFSCKLFCKRQVW